MQTRRIMPGHSPSMNTLMSTFVNMGQLFYTLDSLQRLTNPLVDHFGRPDFRGFALNAQVPRRARWSHYNAFTFHPSATFLKQYKGR